MITKDNHTHIPCPACRQPILFDTNQLLMGAKFICQNAECNVTIGLPTESRTIVESAMSKLEDLKRSKPDSKKTGL